MAKYKDKKMLGMGIVGTIILMATAMIVAPIPVSNANGVENANVFEASGANPSDIQSSVDSFRAFLGANNGVGGNFTTGRREINWDGVPDAFSAPNLLPANFFNKNSPRGVVFFTLGSGFQVSADSDNPDNAQVRFGNIHPEFPAIFSTFSPERLFTALDSPVTEVLFFLPGLPFGATVKGFGAVFTDIDSDNSTKIEYYDVNGKLLFSRYVLPGKTNKGSLSFLGVGFDSPKVFMVRITSGNRILKTPANDVVVMDDFIYGEPQSIIP